MEGEVASAREVHCTEEKVPLETTPPEESETNPRPSETLAFTRRNPKRSTRDAESDLNIDRLTRIGNPGTKSRREKEVFDPALLVSLIRDPNLTTRKRKPLNRRVGDSVWGEIKNLSHILDLQLEYYKLKQEKKNQVALGKKKIDGNNKISNQFVMDSKHLKQEEMLERDLYGALNVQRATKGRETAGPGSSPDSVVYNPVVLQHKQSTKSKKKKEKEGENANHSKRDGLLNASACANQGGLYYLQVDAMGRPIFNGIMGEKARDLSAPGVARLDIDNMPETNNGVPIASLSGSFSSNGTQVPFKYESFLAQLLLPVRLFVPVPPGSIPVPMQSVTSHSIVMPGQLVTVPGLLGQPFPVHMHPAALSLGPLHMPENSAAAEGKPTQVKEQPVLVPLQLDHALAQSIPVPAKPAPPKTRVAWVCCDDCGKWRCIPAELADAIDETNCRWTCKDNAAKEFADCSIPQEKSNAEINAELEISDASGDEGPSGRGNELGDINYMKPSVRDMRPHLTKSVKNALGPAPYTPLKMNLFLHRNRKTQTIDEIMVCNCKPPENGGLGCRSQCLNRMLSIECIEGMCPCGDLCSNQQFQRRNYAKLMYFRCGKKGYGLQLLEDATAGRFLIEYVGEVLDMSTYEARQKEYATIGQKHFYFMTLNGGEVIDACAKGNLGRFINHSCDPNCRTEKWIVNGEVCIGLFAIRDIKKGEELTFDYNYVRVVGAAAKKCFCGSENCKGYIGGDPSSSELVVQEDSDEEDLFEPVEAKREEREEPVHRGAAIVTLSDNFLHKHSVCNKSQDMFGSFAPVLQKDNSVEMHKLSRERLMGCKPDNAVSLLANSLVNGTMDEALALPANSQQAFGLLPRDNSQSVIHPENSLRVSKSNNRENLMRHNTDTVLIKPSDSQGVSNGGGLSRSISSADSSLEICKTESQCKPDSILSLPANSHEVNELLDKEADKNRDMKDVSLPSSPSSIAVPSYSLLQLHLPKVNSLVELKVGDGDGLPNNSVNDYKLLKKESLLQGLPEKAVPLYNSLEECELMDGEKLFQAPSEDCIHDKNFPYKFCTENRDVDDISTPALPDQSVEQDPVGTDIDNLCKSPCTPVSPSNGFAPSSSVVPEHLSSPNEDIPSEEDVPSTPVHVTRYLSNRVHSRRSAGMEADKMSSKPGLCTKPSDFFDVQLEQVALGIKKVNQHDRSLSPPVGTCGMKTVHADAEDEGLAMCQEVKEIVHNTAALNFEEVEEKLNEFLDQDGCISRRRNATKGYLKLLIVTAAAGDTGTSQRLRDISLILDALLKTKSCNVLMDLMKKNGLQMLHTILKQNRDNFNWIPIIRKLLRVFSHLGNMGVLTLEQMNQGPPRPGMESFRESIYKLTKHKNNMVHQIAREFFDRWMPKSMRVYDSFSHTSNSSAPSKRKSLWDHPSDSHSQNPKLAPYSSQDQQVERPAKRPRSESLEEDAPPGFEPIGPPPGFGSALPPDIESVSPSGFGSAVQPALVSVSDVSPVQVALGFRQEKYRPGISVSYGIPATAAQNLGGFVESEGRVSWGIAPSTPFHPFPPLPPYHTIGNCNGENNRPGFRYDRKRRHWGSNLRNQRRFSKSWNNNDDARDRSNNKRAGKYWPKWPRDRDRR